jgi:hypothetical protein
MLPSFTLQYIFGTFIAFLRIPVVLADITGIRNKSNVYALLVKPSALLVAMILFHVYM